MALLLATLLLGCSGSPADSVDAAGGAARSALDQGWIAALVDRPEGFAELVDGGQREAWVALHDNRWEDAARGFGPGPARARAEAELAVFYRDLAALAAAAWPQLATEWLERDPSQAAGPLPALAELARQGTTGDLPGLPEAFADEPCLRSSLALLAGQAQDATSGCGGERPLDLAFDGTFHDPLVYAGLGVAAQARAMAALGGGSLATPGDQGLEGLLFGPWWALADLQATDGLVLDLAGADGPTLAALALPDAGTVDDPQAARERVRSLDQLLDAWESGRADGASADGRALLTELRLVPQSRNRILLAWARQALAQDRPHQATAYLLLAHDVENARQLGPLNSPSLYALAAQASLRTGRTREALDYLSVLEDRFPEVRGLDETVGDLAVLEGLGRQGDSKEN